MTNTPQHKSWHTNLISLCLPVSRCVSLSICVSLSRIHTHQHKGGHKTYTTLLWKLGLFHGNTALSRQNRALLKNRPQLKGGHKTYVALFPLRMYMALFPLHMYMALFPLRISLALSKFNTTTLLRKYRALSRKKWGSFDKHTAHNSLPSAHLARSLLFDGHIGHFRGELGLLDKHTSTKSGHKTYMTLFPLRLLCENIRLFHGKLGSFDK